LISSIAERDGFVPPDARNGFRFDAESDDFSVFKGTFSDENDPIQKAPNPRQGFLGYIGATTLCR